MIPTTEMIPVVTTEMIPVVTTEMIPGISGLGGLQKLDNNLVRAF